MKTQISIVIFVCCVASTAWPQPQAKHKITKFDVSGAGMGTGQGTVGLGVVGDGSVMGWYIDSNTVYHGFLRSPAGKITKFDPTGSQGTHPYGMNSSLAITGYCADRAGAAHGFLRSPKGKFTEIGVQGAGTGSGQGTVPERQYQRRDRRILC